MNRNRLNNLRVTLATLCVVAVFQGACGSDDASVSPPDEPPVGSQTSVAELREGIYDGTLTALDGQKRDASLGVWRDAETARGTLVAGVDTPFAIEFHETGADLSFVSAFCGDCTDSSRWEVDAVRVGSEVRLSVRDADRGTLGFSDGVFVPHDGFKPEIAPVEDSVVWVGRVFAVDAARAEDGAVNSRCELSVAVDEPRDVHFGCNSLESDSAWVRVEPDSWVEDARGASFSTLASRVYEGTFTPGDQGRVFEGRIRAPGEGSAPDTVVGLFRFEEL